MQKTPVKSLHVQYQQKLSERQSLMTSDEYTSIVEESVVVRDFNENPPVEEMQQESNKQTDTKKAVGDGDFSLGG